MFVSYSLVFSVRVLYFCISVVFYFWFVLSSVDVRLLHQSVSQSVSFRQKSLKILLKILDPVPNPNPETMG